MEEHEKYIVTSDARGNALKGENNYLIHLPPKIPARAFWSILVYDNQTDLIIRNGQPWPSVFHNAKGLVINADGSIDVRFGPEMLRANKSNWIKTIPGKGWTMILRLYGAMDSWFDKTWQPGKFEEIPK